MITKLLRPLALGALASLASWQMASADPIADFYNRKTVRVLIGYSTGGGYDLYARLLAKYMGRHIPGSPTLVPENMPGAGSLRVANYLATAAPKDGTVFGTFSRGLVQEGLLHHSQGVAYDATKLGWLGSVADEVSVCGFRKESGIATWQDMMTKSYTVGGTASGSDTDIYPTLLKNLFDLKLKLVTGFPGGADVDLAVQRHEVDGRCGWSWSTIQARSRADYDRGDILIPVQFALKRHPDLPNVPLATELTTDPDKVAVLKFISARQAMARPFAAPPGVPAERLAALRAAFDATMKDQDFLDEAKKLELEVRPVDGQELAKLVSDLAASPPKVLEESAKYLQDSK